MLDKSTVLSDSERKCLQKLLQDRYAEYGFHFLIDDDRRLVFESLHVLCDGDPDRLFALIHPADTNNYHPEANQGQTWIFTNKVAAGEIRACASSLDPF